MTEYKQFLASKVLRAHSTGIEPGDMPDAMKPHQCDATIMAIRRGRSGLFLDTGLGKTFCELEFAAQAADATNGRALILTPLAVAKQIERESGRFHYNAKVIREQRDVCDGINICNYDRLEKLAPEAFGAIVLDESSIMKSFTGKTTRALIEAFGGHRFRLAATATPAPNDHMELGNHSEFLGVMTVQEMLSRFFINDTSTASQEWRLKGHAETAFYDWMASWACMAESPADFGYDGSEYVLPELQIIRHQGHAGIAAINGDGLFASDISATNMFAVKRATCVARAKLVADIVFTSLGADQASCQTSGLDFSEKTPRTLLGLSHTSKIQRPQSWVLWCDTNDEQLALEREFGTIAISITGSQSPEEKEELHDAWLFGERPVLITKSAILGYGVNWQHCSHMCFVGRNFSYESWYQAVRRCWRFGQKRPVRVHLAVAEGEDQIGRVIDRKSDDHSKMKRAMAVAMRRALGREHKTRIAYDPSHIGRLPSWLQSAV